jgi:hypothetical protein
VISPTLCLGRTTKPNPLPAHFCLSTDRGEGTEKAKEKESVTSGPGTLTELDLARELKEKGAEHGITSGNGFTGHRSI